MYCFLSGSYGYGGGAQSIQLALLKSLTNRGEKCKLFDVIGGSVYKAYLNTKLPFEFIEIDKPNSKKDYSKYLTKNDLLIVFDGNFFENLLYFGKSNCKILVWEIFYPWVERFLYTRYFPIEFWARQQEKKILKILVENDAFFFIDYLGKEITEKRLNKSIPDSHYLPIPIEINPVRRATSNDDKSNTTITYVGRSVNWKIIPFIKIINDFERIGALSATNFIVVCDNIEIFKNELKEKIKTFSRIKINYYERLNYEQLNDVLVKADIHFAMGTAALDGAKLGVPTIVIDACYEDFPTNYLYRWIFETNKPILGKMIEKNTKNFDGNHSLAEILTLIKSNKDYISNKCYSYVKENYDIEIITDKIIDYKRSAKLTFTPFFSMFTARYFRLLRELGIK